MGMLRYKNEYIFLLIVVTEVNTYFHIEERCQFLFGEQYNIKFTYLLY